jgi:hypothetical protein
VHARFRAMVPGTGQRFSGCDAGVKSETLAFEFGALRLLEISDLVLQEGRRFVIQLLRFFRGRTFQVAVGENCGECQAALQLCSCCPPFPVGQVR